MKEARQKNDCRELFQLRKVLGKAKLIYDRNQIISCLEWGVRFAAEGHEETL